ncbi:protein kinase domain-containing protein [Streptomyces sp. CA-249302]|uniref:serine/threonine-protein kinase n=1 Tax=Streptomyces sp. CA-249302 TaxID=3240058 RepID=UPI003D8F59CA
MPLHKDDPKSVGGYRLVDRLGAGGMGIVYRGRARSGREVAVKVVHAQYAEDQVFRARFRQEIDAVRKVSGAFTAPVVDADPEAVRPWMATQYVPARSLAEQIREFGALRPAQLRQLALGLVEALRDIHRAGVVHRDLKPANVLMAEDGPRVIDFGISRAAESGNGNTLTETGQLIGTPPFMSPEQFTDARSVGPASDVFSLGALLVFSATGSGPFDADSPYMTAFRVVHEAPVLDGVAQPLRAILERCLTKDVTDRPGLDVLAKEFADALPEPDPADPPTMTLRSDGLLGAGTFPGNATDRTAATGSGRRGGGRAGSGTSGSGASGSGTAGSGRRGLARPLWAAVGTVGAVGLGLLAYITYGPGFPQSWSGGSSPAPASSRWAAVPTGWTPWRTTVFKEARWGEVNALGAADGPPSGSQSECLSQGDAVYCGGDGVLPVRLDGRTGKTVWRAALAAPGDDPTGYNSSVVGVYDGVVLVRQAVAKEGSATNPTAVVALDAKDGNELWQRKVDGDVDPVMSGSLVLTPETGGRTMTARNPRTGAARWVMQLPARDYCTFLSAGSGLYAQCYPTEQNAKYSALLEVNTGDGTVTARQQVPFESGLIGVVDSHPALLLAEGESGSVSLEDSTFGRILLTDPTTGGQVTTKLAKTYDGSATLAVGTLWITGSNGQVTAVSALTGKALWQTRTSVEYSGPPTYDSRTHTLYLASPSGRVAALDTRKGTLLWETAARTDGGSPDDAASPKVLLYGGAVTVMTPDGTLFSLDPAHPDRTSESG